MSQIMTLAEIQNQFDSEWILVGDPQLNDQNDVISGVVLCHSRDRDDLDRVALRMRPKRSAVLYTGKIADGAVIVL